MDRIDDMPRVKVVVAADIDHNRFGSVDQRGDPCGCQLLESPGLLMNFVLDERQQQADKGQRQKRMISHKFGELVH